MTEKEQPKDVVTRFAPSPTGNLHIGGARTALFSYLYARKFGGTFILRIEDTDKQRSKKEFEDSILDSLKWLGLGHDEFYRQSERTEIYKKHIEKLINDGKAYLSREENVAEGERAEVIRFRNPGERVKFTDLIRGDVEFDTAELGDFVIAKSTEEPVYHLAVVIDDNDMGVTHVIRAEEHLSNTPRQILILKALGFSEPQYAHLPLILAPDRTKLSKRHGAVSVTEYRDKGYLPEALINYLALLGWNPGTEQEIFSMNDLILHFDLAKIQKGGAIFNEEKLAWMNKEYIKTMSKDALRSEIIKRLPPELSKNGELVEKLLPMISERISTFGDVAKMVEQREFSYLTEAPKPEPDKLIWKDSDKETGARHLSKVIELLESVPEESFTADSVKAALWDYASSEGRGAVLWPVRFALTGLEKSPDPFTVAGLIGKSETLRRLATAAALLA